MKTSSVLKLLALCCGSVLLTTGSEAEIVHQTLTYPTNAVAGWPPVDFDGDGDPELLFNHHAMSFGFGGVFYVVVHASTNTEVLLAGWGVLPLQLGDSISSSNQYGQWSATGSGSTVWTHTFSPSPPVVIFPIGVSPSTNSLPSPPPGQGVGMPGYGNFLGVRFFSGGLWRYAWVRFGAINPYFSAWPSVVDYAYESEPDTPILAGAGIDDDHDDVWDLYDQCADTPTGEVVNSDGCSISQLVPCDGPWKNHGEYVARVFATVTQFQRQGLITPVEGRAIVRDAARSDCGKQRPPREHHGRIGDERENHAGDHMRTSPQR